MPKFTETNPYKFSKFILHYERFSVPPFQRAYTWKAKQINDLWDSVVSNDEEYFIGNIVCLAASEESDKRLVIIDGQQRLLTISLILAVVRDEYLLIHTNGRPEKERIKHSVDAINRLLLYQEDTHPFNKGLIVLPAKANLRKIYEKIVLREIKIDDEDTLGALDDNQKRFIKNYQTIRRLIRKLPGDKKFERLDDLFRKFSSTLFIAIVCESDSKAYDIFEGLNATGVGLSVADLVKNAVMAVVRGDEAKGVVKDGWEEIESLFEETKVTVFPKFLRHQWISREGYITTSKLFDAIKLTKIRNKDDSEIVEYTEQLLSDAKVYVALRFEAQEKYLKLPPEAFEVIRAFRYLDIDQVYELILAYYNKFSKSKDYSNNQLLNDLVSLWAFSFRASMISINPSEYEKKFADHCKHVNEWKKAKTDRMSVGFHKDLAKLVTDDAKFKDNFVGELEYSNDNRLIVYLLNKIMLFYDPAIKVAEPTIEHILPQDPTQWRLKKKDVENFVHDIGNLTLLYKGDNKALGNCSMREKVEKVFSKSKFQINLDIAGKQKEFEADPEKAIGKRGYELAEVANKIWRMKT